MLITLRTESGLTQEDLAAAMRDRGHDCTRSYLSLIELGLREPNLALARALAEFFRVDMETLFFGRKSYASLPEARQVSNGS